MNQRKRQSWIDRAIRDAMDAGLVDFNLLVPVVNLQKFKLDVGRELAALGIPAQEGYSVDPAAGRRQTPDPAVP